MLLPAEPIKKLVSIVYSGSFGCQKRYPQQNPMGKGKTKQNLHLARVVCLCPWDSS